MLGALANAAVTTFAGACYGYVAWRILQGRRNARSTAAFLFCAAMLLLFGGARQVAAAFSNVPIDLALWYSATCFAALAIVPLAHVTTLLAWGNAKRARLAAAFFLLVILAGLVAVFVGGVDGPLVSDWGTDYQIRSLLAKVLLVLFILLPGLGSGALLVVAGRRLGRVDGRRAAHLGWSCLIYFVVFTADAFGLAGFPLIAARVALAGAAIVAYMGYASSPKNAPSPAPSRV